MSLIEEVSGAASTAAHRDHLQQWRRRVIKVFATVIGMTGVAAVTLGWAALLVRGAVWLAWG
jgi:hypothetical protein